MSADFVHLHVHSAFTRLAGASTAEELAARAAALGQQALALTDRDTLSGAVPFLQACRRHGLRAILGAEVTLKGRCEEDGAAAGGHLVLLAPDPVGYAALCRLISRAHLDFPRGQPRVAPEVLEREAPHLIALSGGRSGDIPRHVLERRPDRALARARLYARLFGPDRFHLELPADRLPGTRRLIARLRELGEYLGVPTVAGGDVYYAAKERAWVADLLACVRLGCTVDDLPPERAAAAFNGERHLKDAAEVLAAAGDAGALRRAGELAARCQVPLELGRNRYPRLPVPGGRPPEAELRRLAEQGARWRYGERGARAWEGRLTHELDVITRLGFADYFLCVADVVRWARGQGIRVAGRGSAADSAVAYVLGITDVDAAGRGHLFERFLSEERAEAPDIDLDFDSRRRDDVAGYVISRYGADRVCAVGAHNTFHARSAVRELGKALGFAAEELDAVARRVPYYVEADGLRAALGEVPEMRDLPGVRGRLGALAAAAAAVAGLPRHHSMHLGGLCITPGPVTDVMPVQRAAKLGAPERPAAWDEGEWAPLPERGEGVAGDRPEAHPEGGDAARRPGGADGPGRAEAAGARVRGAAASAREGVIVAQWDKRDLEAVGLLKLDLLSLRTLGAIDDALRLTAEAGRPIDYERIPEDDAATFARLRRGETVGVFQLESAAQQALQVRLGADCMEDVIASVALIRPGPIKGDMVEPFVRRRLGREEVSYPAPGLEGILGRTYGVVVYQEQVIAIASAVAGFTPGESDRLRRVMSHARSPREMEDIGRLFVERAVAHGMAPEAAAGIFRCLQGYASYGFPEAHAVAFGHTAYRTAYLAEHAPAAYFAGLLDNQPMGFYPVGTLVNELRRRGVRVLGPDVNAGARRWDAEPGPAAGPGSAPRGAGEGSGAESRGPAPASRAGPQPRREGAGGGPGIACLRAPLAAIRGMEAAVAEAIVAERERGGPYRSLFDLCRRVVEAPRDALESLVLAGACDGLGDEAGAGEEPHAGVCAPPNRRALLWSLAGVCEAARAGGMALGLPAGPDARGGAGQALRDYSDREKWLHEERLLGFSPRGHVMALVRAEMGLEARGCLCTRQVRCAPDGQVVAVAGVPVRPHRPPTRSGKRLVFVGLEDEGGLVEVMVPEEVYRRDGAALFPAAHLLEVEGRVRRRGTGMEVIADRVAALGNGGRIRRGPHRPFAAARPSPRTAVSPTDTA